MSKNQPDYFLLAILVILFFWGAFTLATVSFPFSLQRYGGGWVYFAHHFLNGLLPGLFLGFICFKLKLETLKKWSVWLFGLNLLLTLLVFLPKIGLEINGARRWLKCGFFSWQPSEFLKITFLLYFSAWLSNKIELKRAGGKAIWQAPFVFFTVLFVLGIILIKQPDLSTFAIIFAIGFMAYFSSSTPFWHSLVIILLSLVAGWFLIKLSPYRWERVLTLLNPQADIFGKGYQLNQALIAIGSGKWFGVGHGFELGLSRQKFGFLLKPMSDSIFAVIGEELGFLGSLTLIFLFLALFWRGTKAALESKNEFTKILGVGLSFWLAFQAFFNIASISGFLPLAGIPLPFFSYGGSHLMAELIAAGILLNVSRK